MRTSASEQDEVPGGRARFRAAVLAVVPESEAFGDVEWRAAEAIVARALAPRPAAVRRQLALFMRLLDVVALVSRGRAFARLSPPERFALLDAMAHSRLLLLRRGVWGVRTLALMGVYARPEAAQAIGYRASPAGWEARRSATGAMHP